MHPSWIDDTLDSILNYELQTEQLFEQQKLLHFQTLKVIVPSEPPAKRRKADKQCSEADGKENIFTARTTRNQHSSSTKICSTGRQTIKKDSSCVFRVERNLNPCRVSYSKETGEGMLENESINAQEYSLDHRNFGAVGQSEEVELPNLANPPRADYQEETRTILSPPKINPVRGRKLGGVVKAGPSSIASDSFDSPNVVAGAESVEKVSNDPELPCPVAAPAPLRMTRARAKALENFGGLSVTEHREKPAKKPRAQKGRAKGLPQATPSRGGEEFVDIVADVHATEENFARSELVSDVKDGDAAAADDERHESLMNKIDNIDVVALSDGEQLAEKPRAERGKLKAVNKSPPATNDEENSLAASISLQVSEKKHLGSEALQACAKGQVGAADGPTNDPTPIAQEGQSGPLRGRGKAVLKTVTSACEESNVVQGVIHTPLVVERDSTIESMVEDGEKQLGEVEVNNIDLTEDDIDGDAVIAHEEELAKKPRTKRGRGKAVLKGTTSSRVKENVAHCPGTTLSGGEKLETDPLNRKGYLPKVVADGFVNQRTKNLLTGASSTVELVGQVKPVLKSACRYEGEEVADQVVTRAVFTEVENDRVVGTQVDCGLYSERVHDARYGAVLEAEKEEGAETLQESQDALEELNKPRMVCRQEANSDAFSRETLSPTKDVNVSLVDMQPAEEVNATVQSVGADGDSYNQGVEGAKTEGKREDDLSFEDMDSERWEDIKRSVKVRKGRGRAVSNFLGYEDSDLFPPRSFVLGPDKAFDLALDQGMKDLENARSPEEGLKVVMQTGRPFPDFLPEMEAAPFVSSKMNLQRESGLDGGRKDNVPDGRHSSASRGDKFTARQFFISEELSTEPRKGSVSTDAILGPPAATGKKHVVGIPALDVGLEQERWDIRGWGSGVTPKAVSQNSRSTAESSERLWGAGVPGGAFNDLANELKLELRNTGPRELNAEIVIDLSPEDKPGTGKRIAQEKIRRVSAYNRGRGHDGGEGKQFEAPIFKGQSAEWTAELTGGRKLVLKEELLANVLKEMARAGPTLLEAPETHVVSKIEKLPCMSLERVRIATGYQGEDALSVQDAGIGGMKLRERPLSEVFDVKASTQKKVRPAPTSLEGGESLKFDEEQAISPPEPEEPLPLDSSTARKVLTARNKPSPVNTTPTRGNVSPWERGTSNRRPVVSAEMEGDKSGAQITAGGQFNLFKEVFTLKTPLRSHSRNVTEVSADCQLMDQEASPPFHVQGARRTCRSGSGHTGPSRSNKLITSSPVEEYEVGGSSIKHRETAKPPRLPEGLSNRVDLSGGGIRYESIKVSTIQKVTDTSAKTRLHYVFSSPARVDFRDRSGLKGTVCEDQYKNGRCSSLTPDSLQKSGKSGSEARAATVTRHGLLSHEKRPSEGIQIAVSPPPKLSNENWSGDTMVLSDDDDQDTFSSRLKSLGSPFQAEKSELGLCSASCKPERLSLSMVVTFEDQNPREASLSCGVHKAESELAVNGVGSSTNVKISQCLEHGSGSGGTEVKCYKVTVPGQSPVRSTYGSGGFAERLEASKRTLHSPFCPEQPKRSRLSVSEVSGRSCGRIPVESERDPQINLPSAVGEVNAAGWLKRAGADVRSGSSVYMSNEDRGFGAESSGNTSIESRRTSKSRSVCGDRGHVLKARQRLANEGCSGDNDYADDEDAVKEDADLTDTEECSGDSEAGTEDVVRPFKSLKRRIKSFGRKSTSKKREKQRQGGNHQCSGHNQQDQHRLEAEAHSLSPCASYEERGAYSLYGKEFSGNSSKRGTKGKRADKLLGTGSCYAEGYVHHSDSGGLQRNSNFEECEIADIKTPSSSYGKARVEEKSTAKAAESSERPRTSSNIVNPCAQSSRLLSNLRTLIPVSQRPAPNFIPNGKRDVKVKALEAAEAARRLQEKREIEKRERMQKRADAITRRAIEKEKAKEEMLKAEQEFKAAQKVISDSTTAKAVLVECTNSKSLQSPTSKLTRALARKTKMEQEKAKKLEEELKRKEEERKKKEVEILARKRKKEEEEKKEIKKRRHEELLKQRREQEERLRAELEEKEHRHRLLEEAERERKAQEEEARRQRRAERERERERRQKEELEAKAARQAEKEAERKRKEEAFLVYKSSEEHDHRVAESIGAASTASRLRSQQSPDKLRASNLLSTGASMSFAPSARIPSTAFEGRTLMIATPMVQNRGPISSLSIIKSNSLGTGPTTTGKIAEVDTGPKNFATPTLAAVEHADTGPQSYEISPYRSSDDEDEERRERAQKFIPVWASKEHLRRQLLKQLTEDPDEIFSGTKTCSLKEVFGTNGSKKVLDFGRRSGSGDWVKDRVSWKEELQYKIDMGYMKHMH